MTAGPLAGDGTPDGPVVQSLRISFRVLSLATLLLGLGWAVSNCRQVPPESQIVVTRFGDVVRVQQAGLLLAWPRPIEQVELLPAPARQNEMKVTARNPALPDGAGTYLTGDAGAVLLGGTLTWRIVDPVAYFQSRTHVAPALNRLFAASAVSIAAGRSIDRFLVVRTERDGADPQVQAQRQALRGELVEEINRRLRALETAGAPLGVEVTRADLEASLPAQARPGFDAVLAATQRAEQRLADARTEATRTLQTADRESDRIVTQARGEAEERVGKVRTEVAAVAALAARDAPAGRPALLDQFYRERIAAVLGQAGRVITVDPQGSNRLILPGIQP
ncbi:HflK protein [Rhodovastum atsumiense]|uniref:Protease modulator HflK n=1 Tax=Rhodovastum atsumiense TaxID=504468 RepID=A0A5M6IWA8_9PROT|nr:SPFH domain-containing protein [Rhodovastum atsumiense]KAA5611748.1 protease modulator HflK [Rhodovastum atsumiense]CAH2604331.1 HflK protein [Rhodovastum atsumiense]